MKEMHRFFRKEKRYPNATEVYKLFGRRKIKDDDELKLEVVKDIDTFFHSVKPEELKQNIFEALKYRWGFSNRNVYTIKESAKAFNVKTSDLMMAELSLINRLGWQVKLTETDKKEWLRL